jgi:D-erythronate 2-dehydrogenase
MQIVVIGGAGVMGQALLRAIVERGELTRGDGVRAPVRRVISVDRRQTQRLFVDDRVEYVRDGAGTPRLLGAVMGTATDSLFHVWDGAPPAAPGGEALAATLALLDSVRDVLYHCAAQVSVPKVVLASSYAAQAAGGHEALDSEGRRLRVAELLIADATSAGRIDGRCVRLAPVAAAPGRGEFVGPLLRALAAGADAECPVPLEMPMPLTSPRLAAQALLDAHEQPPGALGVAPPPVSAPAAIATVASMLLALERLTARVAAAPRLQDDPVLAGSFSGLPQLPQAPSGGTVSIDDIVGELLQP